MASPSATDNWDAVWDAYDAQQAEGRAPAAGRPSLNDAQILELFGSPEAEWAGDVVERPEALVAAAPPRRRGGALVLAALLLALGLAAAGPGRPVLAMGLVWLRQDPAALLAEIRTGAAVRLPLPAAHAAGGSGAYLADLAAEIQAGWREPEALRRMVGARQRPHRFLRDPALARLERLRLLRPLDWSSMAVEIGPFDGEGGLALDLAWEGGGWRLARIAPLE